MEGDYRALHSAVLNNAEEIAFFRGAHWENDKVTSSFNALFKHRGNVITKQFWMGIFDSMLVKYGAVMVGYAILGLPVFGPGSEAYLKKVGDDPSKITRDYVRNSSLLINLSKAIGKIVVSYKEVQNLAGYTSLVYEVKEVLDELKTDSYRRDMIEAFTEKYDFKQRGEYIEGDCIQFVDVPIVSPNGDELIDSMNFKIERGQNLYITGPNGCGKSSLFRILGSLWPLFGGKLTKPGENELFYIP